MDNQKPDAEQKFEPRFDLGKIYMTAGVAELVNEKLLNLQPCLHRHVCGDWGTVCKEDAAENELSLKQGFRLLSAYNVNVGNEEFKIWIITEADRSATTLLFPDEY